MLIDVNSTQTYAKRESGGKGYNLYLLSREGFPVPPWVVLGAQIYRDFTETTGLDIKILETLEKAKKSEITFAQAEKAVRELFLKTPLPDSVKRLAELAYQRLKSPLIAVRSSAADEDSAQHSFAGQLSTYLFVSSLEEALLRLKECWASGFSERSLSYRAQNSLSMGSIQVAVVFQAMIDSEKSGVLFTCDPIQGNPAHVTINALYGVGEGLVSGLLDGDTFVTEKATGKLLTSEIATKKSKLVRGHDRGAEGTEEVPVNENLWDTPSLSESELRELTELGCKVEHYYRFPQDIEWGMLDGKFYLLQSRPVTTKVRNDEGILYIWDNSNIVESYGGITMPLTFTFAHHVYHWVYIQFCEILLIPQKEIRKMDYFLRNMLGIFNGRVYYNLLNWYKLTSILPGFKYNRSFMETMMGTAHSLEDEIADRIKPPGFQGSFISKLRRLVTGFKFFYFHLSIQKMVDDFLEYFHKVYDEFRKRDYSRMPATEIYGFYQEMEHRLLLEWKAPIVNDYLCMVHFGILKKLTAKWLGNWGESIQNDLLCGEGNLESAEPTRELIRMADFALKNPEIRTLLENAPAQDCMEVVTQGAETTPLIAKFKERVDRYIDLYGFRCMNEMKLEERDLYQDPAFLFVCLKNYLRTGQTDLESFELREKEIRKTAEEKVNHALSGIKLKIYLWSLKHARKAVKNRENTRFCRTRIYGVVRAMFFGMGRDFAARGMIEQPEDIFYLVLSELTGALEGILPVYDLKQLIRIRKSQYEKFETDPSFETAPRFITRGPIYWMNDFNPSEENETTALDQSGELPANQLRGVGCCPGIIEGVVKVVLSPKDDMELNKEILVTLRTDPGWIPLYPSASALLVERGGLLSHSAIVAREMGLPTIVGIRGLTQRLKSGMRVRINGETGIIEIIHE